MKDLLKWYFMSLDEGRLRKLVVNTKISIPGFTVDKGRAPAQLIRATLTKAALRAKTDSLYKTVSRLNDGLYRAVHDCDLVELRQREAELVERYGLADYVLAISLCAPEGDDEMAAYVAELQAREPNPPGQAQQVAQPIDAEAAGTKHKDAQKNDAGSTELRRFEKRVKELGRQLEQANNRLQKALAEKEQQESKYRSEIADLRSANQQLAATLRSLEVESADKDRRCQEMQQEIVRLGTENQKLRSSIDEQARRLATQEKELVAWRLRYPGEDPLGDCYRVVIIGCCGETKLEVISGRIVSIDSYDSVSLDEILHQGGSYDLALVLPLQDHQQRRAILKSRLATRKRDIPNIGRVRQVVIEELQRAKQLHCSHGR